MTPEEIMELEGWTPEEYQQYFDALYEYVSENP